MAVLHSEPLHFECDEMKHVTEKDAHALESNLERVSAEGSSQSADNIKTIDLQEKGYMEHGCQHYRRRCRIRAPCCNEIFACRICHNEANNDINIDQKHSHDIPRHQVKQVICSICGTEQEVQQNCINCGVCMGKYFCEKCKFFDDDVSKQQYHCNDCGICRTGGQENFFHCDKCGCCQSTLLKNNHNCVEGALHHDCPICFEFLFESRDAVSVMPCGHRIHRSCLNEMTEHKKYKCHLGRELTLKLLLHQFLKNTKIKWNMTLAQVTRKAIGNEEAIHEQLGASTEAPKSGRKRVSAKARVPITRLHRYFT